MNIEHLKLILDTLQSAGASGKDMFIWWLVLDKGGDIFCVLAAMFAVIFIILAVLRSFNCEKRLEFIRDTVLPGRYTGEITPSEYAHVIREIKRLTDYEASHTKNESSS